MDITPRFACDMSALTAEERADHRRHSRVLFGAIRAIEELPDGYLFRAPATPETLPAASSFITLEQRCCPFFTLSLNLRAGTYDLELAVEGAAGVKPFIRAELGGGLPATVGFPESDEEMESDPNSTMEEGR